MALLAMLRAAMRQRAFAAWGALSRQRWAIGLLDSRRSPGFAALRYHDAVIGWKGACRSR